MISLEEARARIVAKVLPIAPIRVPLAEARGRILREPLRAPHDFPAFDRSAMDGYSVARDDDSERFHVVMEISAGMLPERAIQRGECARIFTGAHLPEGASQVLPQEVVRRDGEWMIPRERSGPAHIRRRGEDAFAGATLLAPGVRLGACELALLAQCGVAFPLVAAAPKVLHLVTGGELVDPEETPGDGQIRDSNSALVAALLHARGATLAGQYRCGDDLARIIELVRDAPADAWEMLLISGGASVGDYDFGARALRELGFEVHFDRLNLRPGKPLVFATRADAKIAFVLPGNPVSHFVTFHLAVRLALECLEGAPATWPLASVRLRDGLPAQADPRATYWPARVWSEGGALIAQPRGWKNSGDLCGLAGTNALLQILPGSGPIAADAPATCLLLDLA